MDRGWVGELPAATAVSNPMQGIAHTHTQYGSRILVKGSSGSFDKIPALGAPSLGNPYIYIYMYFQISRSQIPATRFRKFQASTECCVVSTAF